MSRRKEVAWVVLDPQGQDSREAVALCQRCGGRERSQLPLSIPVFVAWMDFVMEKHRGCAEQEKGGQG